MRLALSIIAFLITTSCFASSGQNLYPYAHYIPGVHIEQEHKEVRLSPAVETQRIGVPSPMNPQQFAQKLARALQLIPQQGHRTITFGERDFEKSREKAFLIEAYIEEAQSTYEITLPSLDGNYKGHHQNYQFTAYNEDTQRKETFYQHSVYEVAQALANLPDSTRSLLTESIDLHFQRNPQDLIYQKLFGRPHFRAYQSAQIYPLGVLSIFPQTEKAPQEMMSDTMTHEAGHIWSFKCFSVDGNSREWKEWREAMKRDGNQVSSYGASSFLEDAAEMALIYASVTAKDDQSLIQKFRNKHPHRWQILEESYPNCGD